MGFRGTVLATQSLVALRFSGYASNELLLY